jgi:hypothetical protein
MLRSHERAERAKSGNVEFWGIIKKTLSLRLGTGKARILA